MLKKILIIFSIVLSATVVSLSISEARNNAESKQYSKSYSGKNIHFPVIAVGDLQKTSVWESMIGRENNEIQSREIIENISHQNPGAVIFLGDMIFEGDNINQWRYFDFLIVPLKRENIPLFPVIGNHEYWGVNSTALKYLTERFPVLKNSHWYIETCDSVAFIFLDSNNSEYSDEEWNHQIKWFKNKLTEYDNDAAIKGILVFAHHPPYTNSLIIGDEMQVQQGFVPAFDQSKKTLAFITGHAHTYERFIENGKTFIVSGGGGGPRVLLKIGPNTHHDYYNGPSPRPFNYLVINKETNGIKFIVRGIQKDSTSFFTLEEFTLPFNKTDF